MNTWIVANWKSHKRIKEALEWLDIVGPKLRRETNVKVVVCPPFTDLSDVRQRVMANQYPIIVGCQDMSPYPEGAYTGEETATILHDVVDFAIIGHSERRANFGETDAMIAEKVKLAEDHNITPLLCVQEGDTFIPKGVELVAYEPVFAIGTGNPDTPANAAKVAKELEKLHDDKLSVLYGGSVDEKNVKPFLQQDNIHGVLVGGASLDAEQFLKIVEVAYSLE